MADFSPSRNGVAVTPSDTQNLAGGACRALYIGTTGNVSAVFPDGTQVTFNSIAAGVVLPIQALRINNSGTTASNIVALY